MSKSKVKIYELEPQVKLKNSFSVHVTWGFYVDINELMINDQLLFSFEVTHSVHKGLIDFKVNGKPYELLYNYRALTTGNPRSYIILQNNRVIAQYGDDTALKLKPNMT